MSVYIFGMSLVCSGLLMYAVSIFDKLWSHSDGS